MALRPTDRVIGPAADPYMLRWYMIPRNRFFNIYLHCILRDDDARGLHDHPWASLSLILKGSYAEVVDVAYPWRPRYRGFARGAVIYRRALFLHRLLVVDGPVWTLFITGRKVREWGFWCPQGWRHNKDDEDAEPAEEEAA